MEQFKAYLTSSKLTDEKKAGYYLSWVTRLYNFYKKKTKDPITSEEVAHYLQSLSKNREDWQIRQAAEAIQLYLLYKERKNIAYNRENMPISAQWKIIADAMQKVLRLMHRSYRTEQTYIGWVRQFYRFMKGRSPHSLESKDVKDFMTYLAVEKNVAVSTQNQAFN
ncbi:MAG: phage integrase N-terminal SAM-like domain-containing protein [Deltaproteobacteria bacterium]|nr:phage integrase N-terminal SAM-like domain-containing protein [Deltaproteobacteria bacterium]